MRPPFMRPPMFTGGPPPSPRHPNGPQHMMPQGEYPVNNSPSSVPPGNMPRFFGPPPTPPIPENGHSGYQMHQREFPMHQTPNRFPPDGHHFGGPPRFFVPPFMHHRPPPPPPPPSPLQPRHRQPFYFTRTPSFVSPDNQQAPSRMRFNANGPVQNMPRKAGKYNCDTCDRSFEDESQLQKHLDEHEICGRDGCQFEAHSKIVELHVKMQHDSGYALQIMKLTNPEEIKKWREERKKNFPTRERQTQIKLVSPKVLPNRTPFKSNRGRQRGRRGRGFKHQTNHPMLSSLTSQDSSGQRSGSQFQNGRRGQFRSRVSILPQASNPSENDGLKKFIGLNQTTNKITDVTKSDNESDNANQNSSCSVVARKFQNPKADKLNSYLFSADIEDSDSDEGPLETKIEYKMTDSSKDEKPKLSGALGLLINSYGNSGDSDEENNKTQKKKNRRKERNRRVKRTENKPSSKGNKIIKRTPITKLRKHQMSLLEKLLAREIQHERNVIWQCVKYIVENDFFGIQNGLR